MRTMEGGKGRRGKIKKERNCKENGRAKTRDNEARLRLA
jgi:hypothetical protein